MSKSNLPTLSVADQKAFASFADYFNSFLTEHSTEGNVKSNRILDAEVAKEIFDISGRLSFLSTHLPTLSEKTGRTGRNWQKRNSKGKVMKNADNKPIWALDTPAVVIWLASEFRKMRSEKLQESGYVKVGAEKLYLVPWSDVPKSIKRMLKKGETYKTKDGEEKTKPPKIRKQKRDNDPVFKPTHLGLLIRKKKGQGWVAPQWLVLGLYGASKKDRQVTVMEQALIWNRSCLPALGEYIGAPDSAIPSIFDEDAPRGESKDVAPADIDLDDISF